MKSDRVTQPEPYKQLASFLELKGFRFVDFGNWCSEDYPGHFTLAWRGETVLVSTTSEHFGQESKQLEIESLDQFKVLFELVTVFSGEKE